MTALDRTRRPRPALLALAHGSRDPRAAATVDALLARVRELASGTPVAAAYLDHALPDVRGAVDALVEAGVGSVVAVPLLLADAFHNRVDVPRELACARARHPGLRVVHAPVLGGHDGVLAALDARLAEVGVPAGEARRTAVVLAAAGTSDARARTAIEATARRWAALRSWAAVEVAYASAVGPTVDEALATLRTRHAGPVAVASYVLAPGRLPDRIVAAAERAGVPVAAPIGATAEVAGVVLDRYAAASAARRDLRRPA